MIRRLATIAKPMNVKLPGDPLRLFTRQFEPGWLGPSHHSGTEVRPQQIGLSVASPVIAGGPEPAQGTSIVIRGTRIGGKLRGGELIGTRGISGASFRQSRCRILPSSGNILDRSGRYSD